MDWWARRISVCAEDTEQSILLCAQPSQPTVASQPASQPVQHRTEQHSTVTSSRSLATLLTPSLSLQQRSKYTRGGAQAHRVERWASSADITSGREQVELYYRTEIEIILYIPTSTGRRGKKKKPLLVYSTCAWALTRSIPTIE